MKNFRQFNVDDVLEFKKPHPCGGTLWKVIKPGVDLKLECTTCGRVIIIARVEVYKRLSKKTKV